MINYNDKDYVCYLDLGMDLIRGKWKAVILCHLSQGKKRFTQLQKLSCGISQKVLSENLTSLEEDGLIKRKVYPVVPPKVEYSLKPMGKELIPALKLLENWSMKHFKNNL